MIKLLNFFWRTALMSILVGAVFFLIFLALNSTLLLQDPFRLTAKVDEAVRQGVLQQTVPSYPLRPDPWLVWGHTECMILWMATADDLPLRRLVIPIVPGGKTPVMDDCDALQLRSGGESVPTGHYPRYLHGYRVFSALLLSAAPVRDFSYILRDMTYAVPVMGLLAAALLYFRTSRGRSAKRYLGHAGVNCLFITSFGLSFFGTSPAFAFGDMAIMLFWQVFLFIDPVRCSERRLGITMALFGALVAYTEFLTGQIPLSLSLIFSLIVLGGQETDTPSHLIRRCFLAQTAFLVSVATAVALQQGAIAAVFGFDKSFFEQLTLYTAGNPNLQFSPWEIEKLKIFHLDGYFLGDHVSTLPLLLLRMGFAICFLGLGNLAASLGLLAAALLAIAVAVIVALRSGTPLLRTQALLTLGALGALAAWYTAFAPHAIQHSLFMTRPLVGVPMAAIVLLFQMIGRGRTSSLSSREPR